MTSSEECSIYAAFILNCFAKTDFLVLNSNFMLAVSSNLSILFTNYTLHELDNTKMLLYKLSVRFLVVKPACVLFTVNAALVSA